MNDATALAGKTVVITGASSGFGRGAALALGAAGARVVVAARRAAALDEVVAEIERDGGSALAVALDIAESQAPKILAARAVERFGGIDVWVNNAGIGALGMFWDIPVRDHDRVVDVNLRGVIHGAHVALNLFVAQGHGTLVNVGSVDSTVPLAYQTVYAATKAAVLSLGRSLNEELRLSGHGDDIRVGTIMPWAVDTPWWTHAANYTGRSPRMGAMDDPGIVVDAIVAACTDPREEQKVGWKARAVAFAEVVAPDATERLSADLSDAESRRGSPTAFTTGAIYRPMPDTTTIDGGIRERMRREDAGESQPIDPDTGLPTEP